MPSDVMSVSVVYRPAAVPVGVLCRISVGVVLVELRVFDACMQAIVGCSVSPISRCQLSCHIITELVLSPDVLSWFLCPALCQFVSIGNSR